MLEETVSPSTQHAAHMDDDLLGLRLRHLRMRSQLSQRQLAERAGVTSAYISALEARKASPTIAVLRRILDALGTNLGTFFANACVAPTGHVFRREEMAMVAEEGRCYTLLLPSRPDIPVELLDKELYPGCAAEFESFAGEAAGYVVSGTLLLEYAGEPVHTLREGDSFFVPANTLVRGWCEGDAPTRVIGLVLQECVRSRTISPG